MLIGILSDSHGRRPAVQEALALFDRFGVEHIVHCGDVGSVDVFDDFAGRSLTFVWGNMDEPTQAHLSYLETVGLKTPQTVPTRLTLAGKTLAVFHGHERGFDRAVSTLGVDYVFHGHTHVPRDDRRGNTRIINPGALHRAKPRSVATLDLASDEVMFHEIVAS